MSKRAKSFKKSLWGLEERYRVAMMVGMGQGSFSTRRPNKERAGRDIGRTFHFLQWITAIPPLWLWPGGGRDKHSLVGWNHLVRRSQWAVARFQSNRGSRVCG